jgi:arginine decarboxylase
MEVEMAAQVRSHIYNSMWQLRRDALSSLEEATTRLANLVAQGRPADAEVAKARELLNVLDPIENYWAFPGRQRFEQVQRLFAANDYDRCARLVSDINRAIVTDTFRTGSWLRADEAEGDEQQADVSTPYRPYFEVLVVDEMTPRQERALREELRRLRRPEDEFVYELVVVPSFDDALTAALFNFSLQAVVIRRRFVEHSRYDLSNLGVFLDYTASD